MYEFGIEQNINNTSTLKSTLKNKKSLNIQKLEECLPKYIDISEQSPELQKEEINDINDILHDIIQENDIQQSQKAFNILKEYQKSSPFESFQEVFQEIITRTFSSNDFEYQTPTISKYIQNQEIPSIEGIINYIKKNKDLKQESKSIESIQQESNNINKTQNNTQFLHIEQFEQKIFNINKIQSKNQIQPLLTKIFNFFNGKIPKLFNTLLYYPEHLNIILDSFQLVFIEQGPLAFEYVYYLALMTSAASDNLYIFNLFAKLFLDFNGNPEWVIEGYPKIPCKLQKLWELVWANYYHPTALNKYSIELFDYLNNNLNQSEIMHAILIINFTDYLSSLSFGAGIFELEFQDNSEITRIPSCFFPSKNIISKSCSDESGNSLQSYSTQNSSSNILFSKENEKQQQIEEQIDAQFINNQILCTENIVGILQNPQEQYVESLQNDKIEISSEDEENKLPKFSKFYLYGGNSKIFGDKQTRKLKDHISEHDFDWKNNLYEYLNELNFSNLAQNLNQKLNNIKKLTRQNFGTHENIDTTKFREAIWNYVEMILGYKRDNQNFREVQTYLNQQFRSFLRKLVLSPWELTQEDFKQIPYLLQPQEYMHIILLSSESKFYTKLLYGFSSQSNHRKNSL